MLIALQVHELRRQQAREAAEAAARVRERRTAKFAEGMDTPSALNTTRQRKVGGGFRLWVQPGAPHTLLPAAVLVHCLQVGVGTAANIILRGYLHACIHNNIGVRRLH
jgi:hypothetical protein